MNSKTYIDTFVRPNASILEAIGIIDSNAYKVGLVVDERNRLLGTITDGDIRRGLLKGISMDSTVTGIMHTHFTAAAPGEDPQVIFNTMKKKALRHIPIIDGEGRVVGLKTLSDFITSGLTESWVVIMAGGLGTRLRPLTDSCPKPLLPVGGKPILEHILLRFIDSGLSRFFLAVNYKSDMIESHFGDGSKWSVSIEYLYEKKRMGTGGALSLLPQKPDKPIVVVNGDLMTSVNYRQLLEFHEENGSPATVGVREYDFEVPFGVVEVNNMRMMQLVEKPIQKFFVNAGIYVLEPEVLDLIPSNEYYDITTLLQKLIESKRYPAVFPIREYWIDVGRIEDYRKANEDEKCGEPHTNTTGLDERGSD